MSKSLSCGFSCQTFLLSKGKRRMLLKHSGTVWNSNFCIYFYSAAYQTALTSPYLTGEHQGAPEFTRKRPGSEGESSSTANDENGEPEPSRYELQRRTLDNVMRSSNNKINNTMSGNVTPHTIWTSLVMVESSITGLNRGRKEWRNRLKTPLAKS